MPAPLAIYSRQCPYRILHFPCVLWFNDEATYFHFEVVTRVEWWELAFIECTGFS